MPDISWYQVVTNGFQLHSLVLLQMVIFTVEITRLDIYVIYAFLCYYYIKQKKNILKWITPEIHTIVILSSWGMIFSILSKSLRKYVRKYWHFHNIKVSSSHFMVHVKKNIIFNPGSSLLCLKSKHLSWHRSAKFPQ